MNKNNTRWRVLRGWFFSALFVCAAFTSNAFAQTDGPREARLRAEVEPSIVVGDSVTLNTDEGRGFFAIHTEGKDKRIAFVLAHGVGVHPDHGLIGRLRVLLNDAGYSTLSIQMPVRPKETVDAAEYVATFPDATKRIATAHTWLRARGHEKIVLVSHTMGSWMSNVYFQNTPGSPYAAWVAISVTGRFLALKDNALPVLDLYASDDIEVVRSRAWLRRLHMLLWPQSQQVVIDGSDPQFTGKEGVVARNIIEFLRAWFSA
jgi:hypothetical protein